MAEYVIRVGGKDLTFVGGECSQWLGSSQYISGDVLDKVYT